MTRTKFLFCFFALLSSSVNAASGGVPGSPTATATIDLTLLLTAVDDLQTVLIVCVFAVLWALGFASAVKLVSLLPY
jgi:hypothetical protein